MWLSGVEIPSKCQDASGEAQRPLVCKGGKRLPLLTKGSCPSAHTGAEGIRTPMFPSTYNKCSCTIPQSRACVRRASQLPLHKGAVGCSRTSAFIDVSQKNRKIVPHSPAFHNEVFYGNPPQERYRAVPHSVPNTDRLGTHWLSALPTKARRGKTSAPR